MSEIRTVGSITYELTRKKVKNINLRINRDGKVSVSAPPRSTIKYIEGFIAAKESFILEHLQKIAEQPTISGYEEGDIFYYLGKSYPLKVVVGTTDRAEIIGETLTLTLREPENRGVRGYEVERFFRLQARVVLTDQINLVHPKFAEVYGVPMPKFTIKDMKSRWGSCQPVTGKISLNRGLVHVPPECITYLLFHEYAHLIEPNHSPQFHEVVAQFMPDHKVQRKRLKEFGFLL
ncbi:MAG: SprT family zinc-dependent metalloprotease [Eubacteriales bacterium]